MRECVCVLSIVKVCLCGAVCDRVFVVCLCLSVCCIVRKCGSLLSLSFVFVFVLCVYFFLRVYHCFESIQYTSVSKI